MKIKDKGLRLKDKVKKRIYNLFVFWRAVWLEVDI
jgi:hypothetical protein